MLNRFTAPLLLLSLSFAAIAAEKAEGEAAQEAPAPSTAYAQIFAAKNRACGLTASGEGQCWGYDEQWELGAEARGSKGETCTGRAMCSRSALPIAGKLVFASLAVGEYGSCGATKAGELYCWGNNSLGSFATGWKGAKLPQLVELPWKPASLSGGAGQTCALDAEGRAFCWGANDTGKAGKRTGELCGKTPCSRAPNLISETLRFKQISAGGSHTCALAKDGKAYCWGLAILGQLGAPQKAEEVEVPVEVSGGHKFRLVSAGYVHSCGITEAGEGFCWGAGGARLGAGNATLGANSAVPVKVKGGFKLKDISAGVAETCAVAEDGSAFCWGANWAGQLGVGKAGAEVRAEPQQVAGGRKFRAISVGAAAACALDQAGKAFCWGAGNFGQLGAGRGTDLDKCGNPAIACALKPVPVVNPREEKKEEMD